METLVIVVLSVFSFYAGRLLARAVRGIVEELGGNDEDP